MQTSEEIIYEEAAEIQQVEGWSCKHCSRFYGVNEHLARRCCATNLPCECGGRIKDKTYVCCGECRTKKDLERWERAYKKAEPFNEETSFPIYSDTYSKFFYTPEELIDWIKETQDSNSDWAPDEIAEFVVKPIDDFIIESRFRHCRPNRPPHLCLSELVEGYLPDDDGERLAETLDSDASEIMDQLNEFLSAQGVLSWNSDGDPVELNSLIEWVRRSIDEGKEGAV